MALATALSTVALGLSCAGPLPDTCDELGTCGPAQPGLGDAGDGNAMTDGAADGMNGCDPTKAPKDEPCLIDNTYGVFVASPVGVDGGTDADAGGVAADSADGSMSQPYATIAQALANLGTKTRIFVCSGLYFEQVNITTAVSVYGGLSCAVGSAGRVWTYVGASAQVSSPSPAYALSVTGVSSGGVTIEDVSFTSSSATAAGGSSIAALIASSSVSLRRVTLSAGNGVNGADGSTIPNYKGLAPGGGKQVWSSPGGLFGAYSGGPGGVNPCLQFGSSAGGDGGLGCATGLGTTGTANPAAPATVVGRDGVPMDVAPPGDGGTAVMANDPGADGLAGVGGVAASAQVFGTLSPTGWTPSAGGDGVPGNPGQGGAGATDPLYGQCANPAESIGGGGGGAGGCGGSGGKGGGGGGASIALASTTSTVGLDDCILITGAAGAGGAGGAGQDGQAGGLGGDDNSFSQQHAAGAAGGNGAGGAGGAGGTGGISVGILAAGSMVTTNAATLQSMTLGAPGAGGAAGPAGRHSLVGVLTTGMDGRSGAPGTAGTAVGLLKLM